MLSFEQVQEVLTQIADKIPQAIYRELNGGIILLPDTKPHPQSINGDLYILGQYHYEPTGFGRYITIYYGSFCKTYGHLSDSRLANKLEEVLRHELVHHLEHLAGDNSLEVRDAKEIASYKRRYTPK